MSEKRSKKDEKLRNEERRFDIMSPVKILQDEKAYARGIQSYFENLERQAREARKEAEAEAQEALKRTGIITRNGSAKKKIVSWE